MNDDPFHLDRFVTAQEHSYGRALAELQRGGKKSHWIWYIFPQIDGLGRSNMAKRYAITSRQEAAAYLQHPLLGPRLVACAEALLQIHGRTALDILGYPDDMKLRSSMTLFAAVSADGSVFHQVLDRYFQGKDDDETHRIMAGG